MTVLVLSQLWDQLSNPLPLFLLSLLSSVWGSGGLRSQTLDSDKGGEHLLSVLSFICGLDSVHLNMKAGTRTEKN